MASFNVAANARRQSVPYDRNGHGAHQANKELKRVSSERHNLKGRGADAPALSQSPGGSISGVGSSTSVAGSRRESVASEHSLNSGIRCSVSGILETVRGWEPPPQFAAEYAFEICGRSIIGSPILIIKLGQWDFRKMSNTATKETWARYMDYIYCKLDEKMRKNSKIVERPVTQFVAVADFQNFSMKQVWSMNGLSNMRTVIKRYETTYRGAMEACFVVNASASFRMLCSILRPVLSSVTTRSLQVYGFNQNEWKNALLTRIQEENLPFSLGGTLVAAGVHQMDYKKLVYGRRYSIFAQAVQEQEVEADEEEKDASGGGGTGRGGDAGAGEVDTAL